MKRVEDISGTGQYWTLDYGGRRAVPEVERRDAARNRRMILSTASRLFAEKGVTRVTMEEIARESGVGKGTLYRRFPHKGLLCQALLDTPTREFQGKTLRMIGCPGSGALEKLECFLDGLARFMEENLDLLYGGYEPLNGAERIAHLSHPAWGWLGSTVLSLLRMAEREGDLKPGLDLEYLATALVAPFEIDLYYYQRRVRGYSVERISAGVRSLVPRKI